MPTGVYTRIKGRKRPEVSGKNHYRWKGGEKNVKGYIFLLKPSHPRANVDGYIRRANCVMEKIIGRVLRLEEQVHHKGIKYPIGSLENKQDDRPENLQLFGNVFKHQKFHSSLRKRNIKGQFVSL